MRKIIALLLSLCLALGCLPALAEEDAMLAAARTMAEGALADMRADATGWMAVMLQHAEITEVSYGSKSVNVRVAVPTLAMGVSSGKAAGDDLAAYLSAAYAPYLTLSETTTLLLNAAFSRQDDPTTLKWSGVSSPRNFLKKLTSLAGKAKKGYASKQMRLALGRYLLPRAVAEMPKKQPETMPEMASIADWSAQAGIALGLTAEQTERRMACLLMLTELTEVDTTQPLEQTVLTLKVKNWQAMLAEADAAARAQLATMMGVSELPREEVAKVLCDQLPAACLNAYYAKKDYTEETVTVDLAASVSGGVNQAEGLMTLCKTYLDALESKVDGLTAYGKTLSYYPRVDMINAGVLTGTEDAAGQRVTFDMGSDADDHGWIRVTQRGSEVLTGFVRSGVRLTVRLAQGDYTVAFTTGPEWYGENYLFGKEAAFGSFDLTVGAEGRYIVHLDGGDTPVTVMTYEEFEAAR